MAVRKLDPNTRNNDIGLYMGRTRRVLALDQSIGEVACWLKATNAGLVVWRNDESGEEGVWHMEAGATVPIFFTKILTSATIDGNVETTSLTAGPAGELFWASTPSDLNSKN